MFRWILIRALPGRAGSGSPEGSGDGVNLLTRTFLLLSTVLSFLAAPAAADAREPGSVLVFPIHRSAPWGFTVLSITNINTDPALPWDDGGTTGLQFQYVNVLGDPSSSSALGCFVFDRVETLTPADTMSVVTNCHNVSGIQQGYVVVSAQDPTLFKTDWKHDYLIGSEIVVTPMGRAYTINAVPFRAGEALAHQALTDLDGDGVQDYNGFEYELPPDELYVDNFIAATLSSLTLLDFTSGPLFTTSVKFDVWNDNEFALSATKQFRCWFEQRLPEVSQVFSESFLSINTPHDPMEFDVDCMGEGDLETGWARIRGNTASSFSAEINNPSLLGAITAGPIEKLSFGGRLLWESKQRGRAGAFLNYSGSSSENPSLELEKTVYIGHDAGASAPGVEWIGIDAPAAVTFVFDVTNTGDTHLGDLELSDPSLGIDASDWVLASGSVPIPPLGSARFFHETTVDADLAGSATVVGNPTSSTGSDLLGTYSVQDSDDAAVERFHPSVQLSAGVYLGHDGGASCPGYPAVFVGGLASSDLSYCYTITNTGDSHLDQIVLEDTTLGVDQTQMQALSGFLPLAPGASLVYLHETNLPLIESIVADSTVSAVPTDAAGVPRPSMSPVGASAQTRIQVQPTD